MSHSYHKDDVSVKLVAFLSCDLWMKKCQCDDLLIRYIASMSDYSLSIQIGNVTTNKHDFQLVISSFCTTIMSMDDAATRRKNILRLVRKSAATDCDPKSLQESDEHRKKFLECRKQFEEPLPTVDEKPPFFPHWINSEDDTELSVTYKKKGAEITDLRINYVDKNDGNNIEIERISLIRKEPRVLENRDLTVNRSSKRADFNLLYSQNVNMNVLRNVDEVNSSSITTTLRLHDKNALGKSSEKAKRPIDRDSGSNESIRQSKSLQIFEERSASMSSKNTVTLESNRIVDTPRKNENILNNYLISRKPMICRPIVRKVIELKKYDHIVTNVINNKE